MLDKVLPDWWLDEPVRFGSALVVFVNSVIALAVALEWVVLDSTQLALLYLVVLNGVVLLFGEQVRKRVTADGRDPVDPDA